MSDGKEQLLRRVDDRLRVLGMTDRDASIKATGKPDMIRDLRRAKGMPGGDRLKNLADVLDVSVEWLLEWEDKASGPRDQARDLVKTEVAGVGLRSAADVRHAFRGESPLPAIPVLGTAVAGEHGDLDDDIELVELNLSDVLDYKARPASLSNDPRAYGVNILTDSMAPKFEPGETVAVTPKANISIRDYVLVQLRGTEGGDERVQMVLVKRLVRRGATFVELEQFNPPKTFRIDARRVAAMHKIAGTLY